MKTVNDPMEKMVDNKPEPDPLDDLIERGIEEITSEYKRLMSEYKSDTKQHTLELILMELKEINSKLTDILYNDRVNKSANVSR